MSLKLKQCTISAQKIILGNCTCENGKYAKSIGDDSVITCDEIIEEKNSSE